MSVMSALVFAMMLGLAATWTKAKLITGLLDEFQKIVLSLVARIIIPILPLFIGTTFCGLAYEGTITRQLPVFLKIIVLVLAGHFIWMALLYILAGIYSGENPLEVVRHYGPAYLTAVGPCPLQPHWPLHCSVPPRQNHFVRIWSASGFLFLQTSISVAPF